MTTAGPRSLSQDLIAPEIDVDANAMRQNSQHNKETGCVTKFRVWAILIAIGLLATGHGFETGNVFSQERDGVVNASQLRLEASDHNPPPNAQFDAMQTTQQEQIDNTAKRLELLKQTHEKRLANKEQIVDRRAASWRT